MALQQAPITASVIFASLACAATGAAVAQVQTGHYIPGWNAGLQAGVMAPDPGFYMGSTTHFYHADDAKDGDGNKVPDAGQTDSIITELAFVWRPDWKVLGANYQAVLAPSVGNLSGRPILVDGEFEDPPVGLSDTFIAPAALGWHWQELDLLASFGIFAPTGKYNHGSNDNTGMGFWSFMPYTVASYRTERGIFAKTPLLLMGAFRYEWHSEQDGHNFTPGDNYTIEWGVGLEVTAKTSIGLNGFFYRQSDDASGSDATPTSKYRADGVGASVAHSFGPIDANLRLYQDQNVENGPDGTAVFLELGWGWPKQTAQP